MDISSASFLLFLEACKYLAASSNGAILPYVASPNAEPPSTPYNGIFQAYPSLTKQTVSYCPSPHSISPPHLNLSHQKAESLLTLLIAGSNSLAPSAQPAKRPPARPSVAAPNAIFFARGVLLSAAIYISSNISLRFLVIVVSL